MSPIDIFALIVLITMVLTALGFIAFLGMWPGMVAKKRRHPQVDAITIGSWIAILTGGVLWPIILIWAYVKTDSQASKETDQ